LALRDWTNPLQRMFDSVLDGMKGEGEDGAEERVGETVAHADFVHEKIRYECFHCRVSKEEQRDRSRRNFRSRISRIVSGL